MQALRRGDSLLALRDHLVRFRESGGGRARALAVLERLRSLGGTEHEDRVLELMDFVVGFCSPHMLIWPGATVANE